MAADKNETKSKLDEFNFLKRLVCYAGEWKSLPYLATYDYDLNSKHFNNKNNKKLF